MDGICSHSFIHVCLMAVLYSWSTTDPAASRKLEERQSYTGNQTPWQEAILKNVYFSGKGRQSLHIHVMRISITVIVHVTVITADDPRQITFQKFYAR